MLIKITLPLKRVQFAIVFIRYKMFLYLMKTFMVETSYYCNYCTCLLCECSISLLTLSKAATCNYSTMTISLHIVLQTINTVAQHVVAAHPMVVSVSQWKRLTVCAIASTATWLLNEYPVALLLKSAESSNRREEQWNTRRLLTSSRSSCQSTVRSHL